VYRVSLHHEGMARRILNFDEYALHMRAQLRHEVAATFGTPGDVTVSELALEWCFPAYDVTGERLRRLG
jgi:hypothetical protein